MTYLIHCLQLQKQKYGISVVDVLKIYQNEIHYTETSQLIWFANRLTGFCMVSLVIVCLLFTLNKVRTTFSSLILRFYIFTLSKVRIPAEIYELPPNSTSNIKQICPNQLLLPLNSWDNLWFSDYFRGNWFTQIQSETKFEDNPQLKEFYHFAERIMGLSSPSLGKNSVIVTNALKTESKTVGLTIVLY